MQHPSDAAAGSIDLHSTAGACQRVATHLQPHFSSVTVLLAAAWALILHATHSVLACIASGVCNQTAAAKAHLLLLKRLSPSRFYRTAAAKSSPQLIASHQKPGAHCAEHQQSCSTDAGVSTRRMLRSRHASTQQQLQETPQHRPQHSATPCADVSCSKPSTAAAASGPIMRIPMQLHEHRGRLTIALDLDETLLCTYRLEHTPGCGDMLQLVPSNRAPGSAHKATSNSTSSSSGGLSWSSLLGRANSFSGSSSSSAAGSYSINTTCSGLPSELGAAARASAWMHFTAPSPPATPRSSSSAPSLGQPQQQQQSPAPHTLAVFLRPGCQEFLQQLSCFAEVVLFTAASPGYAAPLAQLLDPSGQLFRGRLYGDACTNHAGRRGVKNLEVLGRDVSRVVLVDNCLFSFLAQPRNGLPCLPYHGAQEDGQLMDVILPLLRSLAQVGGDIRPLLDAMFRVRDWLASRGYHLPEHSV